MTLLFAGHDTTTSTIVVHVLRARPPPGDRRAAAAPSRTRCSSDGAPERRAADLGRAAASSRWCSTRRCASTRRRGSARAARSRRSSSTATRCPRGRSSTTARGPRHHLPDVFERARGVPPRALRAGGARRRCPKGAYVPFGGGSRTCIGMRFGQLEVRAIATLILSRFTLVAARGLRAEIRQMPTISPKRRAADASRSRHARLPPRPAAGRGVAGRTRA